jgi:hypothetical protein
LRAPHAHAAAFLSIARQITGLVGERGLLPAAAFLAGSASRSRVGVRSGSVAVLARRWRSRGCQGPLSRAVRRPGGRRGLREHARDRRALGALSLARLGRADLLHVLVDLLLLEAGFLAIFMSPAISWRPRFAPRPGARLG